MHAVVWWREVQFTHHTQGVIVNPYGLDDSGYVNRIEKALHTSTIQGGNAGGQQLIFLSYAGSIAHGTYNPVENPESIDDIDLMGVAMPPIRSVVGLERWEGVRVEDFPLDATVYSLPKFVRLLLKSNPNVLTLLWNQHRHILKINHTMQPFFEHRQEFLSKRIYSAVRGYALDQRDHMSKGTFNGRMGEKRKELFRKYGYDTKAASHCLRLLIIGTEVLFGREDFDPDRTGKDAEFLRGVKNGEYPASTVQRDIDRWLTNLDWAHAESQLPDQSNSQLAEQLLMDAMSGHVLSQYMGRKMGESLKELSDKPPVDIQALNDLGGWVQTGDGTWRKMDENDAGFLGIKNRGI